MAAPTEVCLENPPFSCDFQKIAKRNLQKYWQSNNKNLIERRNEERNFLCTISRIMSGHSAHTSLFVPKGSGRRSRKYLYYSR